MSKDAISTHRFFSEEQNDHINFYLGDSKSVPRPTSSLTNPSNTMPTINYELIGIVIHSGQANAGHYYSFIKDIRRRHSNNTNQWYRFNDTSVEEIQLTEQMLEEECFGGTFRVQKDNNNSSEERTRFWNAYMLIYQCIEPSKLLPPPAIPSSPNTNRSSRHIPGTAVRVHRSNQRDSLSQLADLVVRSENSDLFKIEKPLIPSRVLACVKDENLEFLKNRDTYCDDYFQLIYKLSNICFDDTNLPFDMEIIESDNDESSYDLCTKLALNFLFNTHLRTHRRLRKDGLQQWIDFLSRLLKNNSTSCLIFYNLLNERKDNGLKLYLLDCPIEDIRYIFEQICEQVLQATYLHLIEKNQLIEETNLNINHETLIINIDNKLLKLMKQFIEQLISLLDKSVVEQVKHSQAFFQLIYSYIKMNKNSIDYLLKLNTFTRLMNFLLGENIDTRRWNSGQAKEFAIIHEIIASLALASYLTIDLFNEHDLQLKTNMNIYFQGKWTNRYLKEICYAFQEISPSQLILTIQLMETLASNNEAFSEQLIRIISQSIAQAPTNDLKSLFKFLSHILVSIRRDLRRKIKIFSSGRVNSIYEKASR
jgi:ubiquitin carboxyl-terminal hydrolase 9/24